MSQQPAQEQRQVYYSGRVQGVGFRYTVRSIASRFAVTGFVKNLADGRVELVAEGAADQLHGFLEAIEEHLGGYIADTREEAVPAGGRFSHFEIRF